MMITATKKKISFEEPAVANERVNKGKLRKATKNKYMENMITCMISLSVHMPILASTIFFHFSYVMMP